MSINALQRVQRCFWALTTTAVLAAGVLYQGLRSAPGPGTGLLVLAALLLAASAVQAARILTVLAGLPRLPKRRRTPGPQPADRGGHEHGRER
ncbi:hypothetical protein [Streptomyces sp. NBC_00239]|uniref:hypothetical protein n=1 Tax=Streptomyces sp. NBC_00239 TaxID=2903640 RepID=UPI002E2A3E05|nr:hypothetical protein [Streptomyces sp. NBC_00239]